MRVLIPAREEIRLRISADAPAQIIQASRYECSDYKLSTEGSDRVKEE